MYLFDIHLFDLDWAFTDMSGEYLNLGKSSWANYISWHSKCPTTPSPHYTSMPRFAGEWLRPSRTKSWIIKQTSTASAISTVQQRKVSQNPCTSPRCSKFRSSNLLSLSNLVFDPSLHSFPWVTSRYSWNPQAGSFPASQLPSLHGNDFGSRFGQTQLFAQRTDDAILKWQVLITWGNQQPRPGRWWRYLWWYQQNGPRGKMVKPPEAL